MIDKEGSHKAKVSVASPAALHKTGMRKGTKAARCTLHPWKVGSRRDAGTLRIPPGLQTCKTPRELHQSLSTGLPSSLRRRGTFKPRARCHLSRLQWERWLRARLRRVHARSSDLEIPWPGRSASQHHHERDTPHQHHHQKTPKQSWSKKHRQKHDGCKVISYKTYGMGKQGGGYHQLLCCFAL